MPVDSETLVIEIVTMLDALGVEGASEEEILALAEEIVASASEDDLAALAEVWGDDAAYDAGQPCKQGETAENTDCMPAANEKSAPLSVGAVPGGSKPKQKRATPGSQLPPSVLSRMKEIGIDRLPPADVRAETVTILQDLAVPDPTRAIATWPEVSRTGRATVQRAYLPAFHAANAKQKWDRVRAIEGRVDGFRAGLIARLGGLEPGSSAHQSALVAGIIASTGLRPGWDQESVAHGHFGISSLRPEHIAIEGGRALFDYVGKEGIRNRGEVTDPALVRVLAGYVSATKPGAALFPAATAGAVKREMPAGWKVKDLRTVMAAKVARAAIDRHQPPPPPLPEKGAARVERAAIRAISAAVAKQLNNQPAQAEASYILPQILDGFRKTLHGEGAA